jgi:Tfp pilus assembly protein PilO
MKISNGVSLGNIWSIVITLMALAVLWGSSQSKLEYVEGEIEDLRIKKANKDVIEVKLEVMSSDISEIKEMLRDLK